MVSIQPPMPCCNNPGSCNLLCDHRMRFLEDKLAVLRSTDASRCCFITQPQYVDAPRPCSFQGAEMVNGKWFCKTHHKIVLNNLKLFVNTGESRE